MSQLPATPSVQSEPIGSRSAQSRTKFALRFLILFALGCAAILALEVAEKQGTISKLGESSARVVICSVLLGILVVSARRLERSIRTAVMLCTVFVGAELCFEVLEDLRIIQAVFSSTWKHGIEKLIVACWTFCGFYLIYTLVSELDKSNETLRARDFEMREANRELSQALANLKSAQSKTIEHERLNALGHMASGVAHDLNNALTPVESLSRALLEGTISFDREAIELIHFGANHSMGVVKNLQHFYRTTDKLEHEVVDLADIVKQTVELTQYRWRDAEEKRGVRTEIEMNLESRCRVRGNSTELIQLIANLVLNAIESMEHGGVISISAKRRKGNVELSVADQGCGMTQAEIDRCFEPFYSKKDHGSGLGLSVCLGIVRRHQATIDVETPKEGGCQFLVQFPAVQPQAPPPIEVPDQISLQGKKILCIDDNERVRRATQLLFEPTGAEFHVVGNGSLGLELLKTIEYDLVVTDFGMKEMCGREVVTQVKTHHPDLPIAVVSGWCRNQVMREFNDGLMPDFVIEKPLNVQVVQACLADIRN